jgi:hypothetical protein
MFNNANLLIFCAVSLSLGTTVCGQILSPPGRGLSVPGTGSPQIEPVIASVAAPKIKNAERKPAIVPEEKRRIEPEAADVAAFRRLLKKPNYGIVKLLNSTCLANADDTNVVSVVDGCLNSIPGNGSDFSFRRREHSTADLSDLKFKRGRFIVGSVFTQGLIIALGETDLEKIELGSDGVGYIVNFKPSTSIDGAKQQTADINRGVSDGRFIYSGSAEIKLDETYVLRSIAYRLDRQIDDKRCDIVIAFQVVKQDDEGSVTLVWKELLTKESPKLKIER